MRKIGHRLFGLIFLLTICSAVWATKPNGITKEEVALLPAYCLETYGFPNSQRWPESKWNSVMGASNFRGIHHSCWAQISFMRAMRSANTAQTRKYYLESALADYKYIIDYATDDFILLPEIYTRMGQIFLLLNQINDAEFSFKKAREIKLDYWPAYTHWAEYLISKGRRGEAKDIIRVGLENEPSAKMLIQQYRQLGGDPNALPKAKKPATEDAVQAKPEGESNAKENTNTPQ